MILQNLTSHKNVFLFLGITPEFLTHIFLISLFLGKAFILTSPEVLLQPFAAQQGIVQLNFLSPHNKIKIKIYNLEYI